MRLPSDPTSSFVRALLIAAVLAPCLPAAVCAQDAPPVITAPSTITAQEGEFLSVTITATSSDPNRTVTFTSPPFDLGCGLSFSWSPGTGQATGTVSGTPGFT